MLYTKYSKFLNLDYNQGFQDCFGLINDFYKDIYGIEFQDYARPVDFYLPELNLIPKFAQDMGLQERALSRQLLREGDILVFKCAGNYPNHVGIYVGNNLFIHHMENNKSKEDNLDHRWFRRLVTVYYLEDVQNMIIKKDNWFELLLKGNSDA